MGELIWVAFFGAGIFQAIFLAATITFRRHTNKRAARYLAAALAVLAVGLSAELVQAALAAETALLLAFLNINTELAFGPLVFLVFRAVVQPERAFRLPDTLLFLPFAAGTLAWIAAWTQVEDPATLYQHGYASTYPVLEYLLLKASVMAACCYGAWRVTERAAARGERLVFARRSISFTALQRWLGALCVLLASNYLLSFADALGFDLHLGSDQWGGMMTAGLAFVVAWMIYSRPWLLSLRPGSGADDISPKDAEQLARYLREERPWLEPELTRAGLANALGWSEHHLSTVIRDGFGSGFYDLLTRERLAEFERLARDPARRESQVLALAFAAGFSSKAAFYRAFRERHGTTPTRFRRSVLADLPEKTSR